MDLSAITESVPVETVPNPVETVENGDVTMKLESPEKSVKQEEQPALKKAKLESSREASADVESNGILNGPPMHEIVGGSSIRQYLNKNMTKYVLEGLKEVAAKKPQDPLIYLGEYLVAKGKELKENEGKEI